eukprot:6933064-Karenia_brevis.AAC.1
MATQGKAEDDVGPGGPRPYKWVAPIRGLGSLGVPESTVLGLGIEEEEKEETQKTSGQRRPYLGSTDE